jgi:hypothetical protein
MRRARPLSADTTVMGCLVCPTDNLCDRVSVDVVLINSTLPLDAHCWLSYHYHHSSTTSTPHPPSRLALRVQDGRCWAVHCRSVAAVASAVCFVTAVRGPKPVRTVRSPLRNFVLAWRPLEAGNSELDRCASTNQVVLKSAPHTYPSIPSPLALAPKRKRSMSVMRDRAWAHCNVHDAVINNILHHSHSGRIL